jgi:hypothetical protein
MQLLKNSIPFILYEQAQLYFNQLNHILTSTPLLKTTNYNQDFILYLVTYGSTIRIVIIQTDEEHNEHDIYYLIKGLVGIELHYPYVEKLEMAIVFDV